MDFKELCNRRFSARKFTPEKVSDDDLQYILECTQAAPSAVNKQPWKFIIIRSDEAKKKLQACYDRPWFASAPLYIVCMKNEEEAWVRKYDGHNHSDIDIAIAAEHINLAAASRGLGSCWVCAFDTNKMAESFPYPSFKAAVIIPIGHIANDCPHPERKRKDLQEIIEEL